MAVGYDVRISRPCNFDPIKPHFCIVKRGCQRGIICFLIYALKYKSWVFVKILEAVLLRTHN